MAITATDRCDIHEAIAYIKRDLKAIGKNQRNEQQNFKFRGIDDLYNELHSLFGIYGVHFATDSIEIVQLEKFTSKRGAQGVHLIAKYTIRFFGKDGSSFVSTELGEAMDYGDKACNKAKSVAHKYAIIGALSLPTADLIDADSESHEVSPIDYELYPEKYLIPIGDDKGKSLSEWSIDQVTNAIQWMESKGTPLKGQWADFKKYGELYIESLIDKGAANGTKNTN